MKPGEILLASTLLAAVAGAGAAYATMGLQSGARGELGARSEPGPGSDPMPGTPEAGVPRDDLVRLQLAQGQLTERLARIEERLEAGLQAGAQARSVEPDGGGRTPVAAAARDETEPHELTPSFVASVEQALGAIQEREDAEREEKRKELQAQRIEERVAKLQQELGLNSHQATDMRTALIAQDDGRERLFQQMREGTGEPMDMRESMRQLREDTLTTLQGFLTADQYDRYREVEESDFGRRGFDFGGGPGGPGGRGPGGSSGRQDGRRGR